MCLFVVVEDTLGAAEVARMLGAMRRLRDDLIAAQSAAAAAPGRAVVLVPACVVSTENH
jgi:hypothetical protein